MPRSFKSAKSKVESRKAGTCLDGIDSANCICSASVGFAHLFRPDSRLLMLCVYAHRVMVLPACVHFSQEIEVAVKTVCK